MNDAMGQKKKSKGLMVFNWNIPELLEGLKKLHLLDEDFVYQEQPTEEEEEEEEHEEE